MPTACSPISRLLMLVIPGIALAAALGLGITSNLLASEASQSSSTPHSDQPDHQPYQIAQANIIINVPIGPLLAMLQDADQQHQWLPYTHRVTVLEPASAADLPAINTLVQFETETRWPFKPRDAITLFEIQQPEPNRIRINMLNRPLAAPALKGYLRIEQAEGFWLLSAIEKCQTQVHYESGSRWGGLIPQWLVDSTNARIATTALENLKAWSEPLYQAQRQQTHPEYKTYDFLTPAPLHDPCP